MEVDRHKLWRIVDNNRRSMEAAAPDGFRAVVKVWVAGRADPILLHEVQTVRDTTFQWTFLFSTEDDMEDAHPSDRITLVRDTDIERVEVGYRLKDEATAFIYRVIDLPQPDG